MSTPSISSSENGTYAVSQTASATESSTVSDGKVELTRYPSLVMIKNTPKGRGVFALAPILARTVVEVSPVLVLDHDEIEKHIRNTKLWFYTYNWRPPSTNKTNSQPQPQTQALPLGLGSLFNHASSRSLRQNTGFTRDYVNETITYLALRDVAAGEELCICYGEEGRLGFVDADAAAGGDEAGPMNGDEEGDDADGQGLSVVEEVDIDVFADDGEGVGS